MKIQSNLQAAQQTGPQLPEFSNRLHPENRAREGVQKALEAREEPSAQAKAGAQFVRENPAPDPKEGVVMELSAQGKLAADRPQDKVVARDADGSVVRRQSQEVNARADEKAQAAGGREESKAQAAGGREESKAQAAGGREDSKAQATGAREESKAQAAGGREENKAQAVSENETAKTPREAVEARRREREEAVTEIKGPQEKRAEEAFNVAKDPKTPQEEERAEDAAISVTVRQDAVKTPKEAVEARREAREEAVTEIKGPMEKNAEEAFNAAKQPQKDALEDISLEGTATLEEYRRQQEMQLHTQRQAERQTQELQGAQMLRVA